MFTYITDTLKQHLSFVVIVMFIICIFNDDPHNTQYKLWEERFNGTSVISAFPFVTLFPSFHPFIVRRFIFSISLTFHFYWRILLHQLSITWSTWIGWMQQRTLLIVCSKNWIKHSLIHSALCWVQNRSKLWAANGYNACSKHIERYHWAILLIIGIVSMFSPFLDFSAE